MRAIPSWSGQQKFARFVVLAAVVDVALLRLPPRSRCRRQVRVAECGRERR